MVGDSYIDYYVIEENSHDQEVRGETTKMIITRTIHRITRECVDLVSIEMDQSEDVLDTIQLTCDSTSSFTKAQGIIVFASLIYLRDQPGEPVWVLYVLKDLCELRTYTDKDHNLIGKKERHLTWEQCTKVIKSQKTSWLPKLTKMPKFSELQELPSSSLTVGTILSQVQNLINKQSAMAQGQQAPHQTLQPGAPLLPQPLDSQPSVPAVLQTQPLDLPLRTSPLMTSPVALTSVTPNSLKPNDMINDPHKLTTVAQSTQEHSSHPVVATSVSQIVPPLPVTTESVPTSISTPPLDGPESASTLPTADQPPSPPTENTNNSPGVFSGLLNKFGFFKKPETDSSTVSSPSPPPARVETPKKKGWLW